MSKKTQLDIYKEELKSEEERYKKVREEIADGITTPFWLQLKVILLDLMEQADNGLKDCTPDRLAELQQMFKIPHQIILIVEGLAEEQKAIDDKLKEEKGVIKK